MVLLPVNIQFWPGAIKIIRFPSSFIILLKRSCSVSFKEVKELPLFLLSLYDLLLHRKRSRNMGTFLKGITESWAWDRLSWKLKFGSSTASKVMCWTDGLVLTSSFLRLLISNQKITGSKHLLVSV